MESPFISPQPEVDPLQLTISSLHKELTGLFLVSSVQSRRDEAILFQGRLLSDAASVYDLLRERYRVHGYTPMLRRRKNQDEVMAVKGIVDHAQKSNPAVNVLLLVATIVTTLIAGAGIAGEDLWAAVISGSPEEMRRALMAGLPFMITLLGILGVHELGHYLASRLHGVQATLPYFIPMPIVGIGTLGAFIQIRSPLTDRKVLFDIGMAGPYAGLLVAIPMFFVGLFLSLDNVVPQYFPGPTLAAYGSSIFIEAMVRLFGDVPVGGTLLLHPVFFAAWLGLFLTALNLLPAGQLDGGHAAYAIMGRWAHTLAYVVVGLLILVGAVQMSMQWFIWAFFILISGLRHPPPMNDITDVGMIRKAIGVVSILLFILIFPVL